MPVRPSFPLCASIRLLLGLPGRRYGGAAPWAGCSALGRSCRNFQELGVSPDHRRNACVKALTSEKPSASATSVTEAPFLKKSLSSLELNLLRNLSESGPLRAEMALQTSPDHPKSSRDICRQTTLPELLP